MKRVALFCSGLLFQAIFSSVSISQKKTTYGINAGIGIWRMMSLEESYGILDNMPRTYPIGYTLGFSIENLLSKQFSIVNEVSFQKSITTIVTDPGADNLYQRVAMQQIILPILLKYQTSWSSVGYFFIGPSMGYLVNADYVYDDDNAPKGSAEITKDLPAIQTAVEFGVGKGIKISGGELKLELRGQWGVTRFRYKRIDYHDPPDIGQWKNAGLQFVIGYILN